MLALLEYLAIEPDPARQWAARTVAEQALAAELALCGPGGQPFALARQYVKGSMRRPGELFHAPHHNESGYWWRGETPRLASLATMAFAAAQHLLGSALLRTFGQQQLDWILGRNPFNACMLAGQGINNRNTPPATQCNRICNGITAGLRRRK